MDDTQRLNWLINHIIFDPMVRAVLGISDDDLSCPGDVSLGEQVRHIIDQRFDQVPSRPVSAEAGAQRIVPLLRGEPRAH